MNNNPLSADDDDDRTVLRPGNFHPFSTNNVTGANNGNGDFATAQARSPAHKRAVPLLGGINPIENAASKLLPLLVSLRQSHHNAPGQLRNQLIQEIETFKTAAREIFDDSRQATQASYIMCTALDEAAMNTPWGHHSNWSQFNLLSTFHDEVAGGEKFFALLKSLSRDPNKNIQLLELMYVCLALGYEGHYRLAQNGRETLQKVRVWLYDIIQQERSTPVAALSEHWRGSEIKESRLPKLTVLWVSLAGALAIACLSYITLLYNLSDRTEKLVTAISSVKAEPLQVRSITLPVTPIIVPQGIATLSERFENEISNGELAVIESFDSGTVRLIGDNLFASGRVQVEGDAENLVRQIGLELNDYNGAVIVRGFSDSTPIRSARFPSNLALSKARADSVADLLSENLTEADRLSSEGLGSLDPIGDNSTVEGRSSNRRVEITVYY